MATNRHAKVVGRRSGAPARTTREQQRAKMRDLARVARGGMVPPNFHTHIGRPMVNGDGSPMMTRVGRSGRLRIKYEYFPRFTDPEETARVMVRAATRKAVLDARRERMADRIAVTESRRAVKRLTATHTRAKRKVDAVARELRATAAGRKGRTLPRRLRERVTGHGE